jgi:hypothetical protein
MVDGQPGWVLFPVADEFTEVPQAARATAPTAASAASAATLVRLNIRGEFLPRTEWVTVNQ